ncbi:glycosyltransferase [Candidatus Woesearchaeota archaeon]|nr:glycosyltransferase [Candidatus Woesearchaeota archaeon]
MISLCMIVKNESMLLDYFLEHHRQIADEVIIVDTGSSDKTIEIAKKHSCKVHNFKWNDDFSAARNFSIGINSPVKVMGDWMLWLDPDEMISKEYFQKIRDMEKRNDVMGFSFMQKTYTNQEKHPRFRKEEKYGFSGFYMKGICKMFRNMNGIKFEYPVHETVRNSILGLGGKIMKSGIFIEHFRELRNDIKEKERYYRKLMKSKMLMSPTGNMALEMKESTMLSI